MNAEQRQLAARRLRATLDLYDFGVSMMRQNLRRRHPQADDRQIETLLTRWLHERPLLWEKHPRPPEAPAGPAGGDED